MQKHAESNIQKIQKQNTASGSFDKKSKTEGIVKITTANEQFVQTIKNSELHDLKNLFDNVHTNFWEVNDECMKNIAQDKKCVLK